MEGKKLLFAVPEIMLPELASLIEDSHRIHLPDDNWIRAIISDESRSVMEGKIRVWTWNATGLIFAG